MVIVTHSGLTPGYRTAAATHPRSLELIPLTATRWPGCHRGSREVGAWTVSYCCQASLNRIRFPNPMSGLPASHPGRPQSRPCTAVDHHLQVRYPPYIAVNLDSFSTVALNRTKRPT